MKSLPLTFTLPIPDPWEQGVVQLNEHTPVKLAAFKDPAPPSTHANRAARVFFSRLFLLPAKPWFLRLPIIPLEASNNPERSYSFYWLQWYCSFSLLFSAATQRQMLSWIISAESQSQRGVNCGWDLDSVLAMDRGVNKFATDKSITVKQPCLVALLETDAHLLGFFCYVFWFLTPAWIWPLPVWNYKMILISLYLSQSQPSCSRLVVSPFPPERQFIHPFLTITTLTDNGYMHKVW